METNRVTSVFNRVGLAMFLLMAIQLGLAGFVAYLVAAFAPWIAETGWYIWALSYAPLYLAAFPISLLVFRSIPGDKDFGEGISPVTEDEAAGTRWKPRPGTLASLTLVCLGIVYPLNLVSSLLSALIAQLKGSEVINPLQQAVLGGNPAVNILFVAVVAPVMEEIIFRGLLYKKLIVFGGKTYVFVSALIFALFHANLYQLLYAFVLGLLFAGVTCYTGGAIRYTMVLHVAVNFIGSGASSLVLTYGSEAALAVWGLILMGLMTAGIALGIVWFVRHGKKIRFPSGRARATVGQALLRPGMILYMLLATAVMALNTLA